MIKPKTILPEELRKLDKFSIYVQSVVKKMAVAVWMAVFKTSIDYLFLNENTLWNIGLWFVDLRLVRYLDVHPGNRQAEKQIIVIE